MARNFLRYDSMVEAALRDVVRQALARAATDGLPGNHHFYVTYLTDFPGIEIPERLLARFPDEMTIVLQHQFWELEVGADGFAVILSFDDKPERLRVPFAAITAFADPSVNFGLQFQDSSAAAGQASQAPVMEKATPDAGPADDKAAPEVANVVNLDTFRNR